MPMQTPAETSTTPAVSVVVPVRNEADNVRPLVDEIAAALTGRYDFEIVYVNDGSTDATAEVLAALKAERPYLRQIRHAMSCGQALRRCAPGSRAARAPIVITLDGDGQNDPSFLPAPGANAGGGRCHDGTGRRPARGSQVRRLQGVSDRRSRTACARRSCRTARATPAAA